jgi:predicted SAM-dependent methyltransferase
MRMAGARKLHVGCGPALLDGWINADRDPIEGAVVLDATQPLPFPDGCIGYVFSEHFIEHLDYREGERFLRECFRVLAPGGVVRTATPDLRFLVELYSSLKTPLKRAYIQWITRHFIPYAPAASDTFVINNFFRAWGHRFIYDEKTLTAILRPIGFTDVKRVAPGESRHPELRGIERHGDGMPEGFNELETMVLEATRP